MIDIVLPGLSSKRHGKHRTGPLGTLICRLARESGTPDDFSAACARFVSAFWDTFGEGRPESAMMALANRDKGKALLMNIIDLRQATVRQLEPILLEEASHWRE